MKCTIEIVEFTQAANVFFDDSVIPAMERYMHLHPDRVNDPDEAVQTRDPSFADKLFNPIVYVAHGNTIVHHNVRKHGTRIEFASNDQSCAPLLMEFVAQRIENNVGVESRLGSAYLTYHELQRAQTIRVSAEKIVVDAPPYTVAHLCITDIHAPGTPSNDDDAIDHRTLLSRVWDMDGPSEISVFKHLHPQPGHATLHTNAYLTGQRIVVPASYYASTEPERVDWSVTEMLVMLGFKMYGIKVPSGPVDWSRASVSRLQLYGLACTTGISLLAKCCYYCPDVAIRRVHATAVTRFDDDNFSDVAMLGSGDCEDLAKLLFSVVRAIMLRFDTNADADQYPLTAIARRIFDMYVPFMLHGGVTTAAARDADMANESCLESHFFTAMIPRKTLSYALFCGLKSCESSEALRAYASIAVPNGQSYSAFAATLENAHANNPSMPVYILEGTGFLAPVINPHVTCAFKPTQVQRMSRLYEARVPSQFGGVGFTSNPSVDASNIRFYKTVVAGMTDSRLFMGIDNLVFFTHLFEYGIPIDTFAAFFSGVSGGTPLAGGVSSARCLDPNTPMPLRAIPYFRLDPGVRALVERWTIKPFSVLGTHTPSATSLSGQMVVCKRHDHKVKHAQTVCLCTFEHSNITVYVDVCPLKRRAGF